MHGLYSYEGMVENNKQQLGARLLARVRQQFSRQSVPGRLQLSKAQLPSSGVFDDSERLVEFERSQTTTPEYFVGVIPESHESTMEKLRESELGVSYVSYPKSLADEDVQSAGSSSWVYRSWPLSHFQLHILLFEVTPESVLYVFCHHEPNWLRHPVSHLRQAYLNPTWGRAKTVELVESAGLPVDTCAEIDGDYDRATDYCAIRGELV